MKISLPYGKDHLTAQVPEEQVNAVLRGRLEEYVPPAGEAELIAQALARPIGSPTLEELARGKENIVLIASDHTRPVPSRLLVPPMLEAIHRGNPKARVTILIATGCHRGTTRAELVEKFGEEIVEQYPIVVHDCADEDHLVTLGTLPSGGVLRINRLAAQADLLISEGFIEPHFFAGFSGGRKSVLPGIAARETVYWNHNAAFIQDPLSRSGILEGNPIHKDMLFAAQAAKLAFVLNVVINARHEVVGAFAGDCEKAHREGTELVRQLCAVPRVPGDIVITSNNGHPLDQNIYQAVKGMCTAEAACAPGAVIVIAAACGDGHGGEVFARTFLSGRAPAEILAEIQATPAHQTQPDQWQSQIFARILAHHRVVLISQADPDLVRGLQMEPAANLEDALTIARRLLGREGKLTVIPEGVSTIVSPR